MSVGTTMSQKCHYIDILGLKVVPVSPNKRLAWALGWG